MSTATSGRAREHRVRDHLAAHGWEPMPRTGAPLCACGCGKRTSAPVAEYIRGHRPASDPSARFWAKVDRRGPDECWLWTAYLYRNGYATFQPDWRGPKVMAHRFAYEDVTGESIPDDMTIDHLCRNRACQNPAHMEIVTQGENSRRGGGLTKAALALAARAAEACSEGHPRTPEHARRTKDGHWRCKTCRREKRARGEWK